MQPGDIYQPPPGSLPHHDPYAQPANQGYDMGQRDSNPFADSHRQWGPSPSPGPPVVPPPPQAPQQGHYRSSSNSQPYGTPYDSNAARIGSHSPYNLGDPGLTSPPPLLPSESNPSIYPPSQGSGAYYGGPGDDPTRPLIKRNGPPPMETRPVNFEEEDQSHIHYGPVPNRVLRRNKTRKRVQLFQGHLVLDVDVPSHLLDKCPIKEGNEFTKMRYTAVTCDPDNFVADRYTLRQNLYSSTRSAELFIVVTMYNEDDVLFCRTMRGIMQNIAHLCTRSRSQTWSKEGWKKVVVCIVSDGRLKINPRTRSVIAALGCYQDGVGKNVVNGKPVTAHLYEYTTQLRINKKGEVVAPNPEKHVPIQLIFCLKEKNQKKINSHRWFFNAFGRCLKPNVCVLLDVGTQPGPTSIYHLWKAFDIHDKLGGACGEIVALKGKYGSNLMNPLVAAQNFEYKMSNILDKPLESVFGYITVLPGAFSAYRYIAIQNNDLGQGPLEKYFLGETLHGAGAGIFEANMYLAEDRILCWELVSKRSSNWTLHYVKSAYAVTDVPDQVPELVSQRRRWLNGSFFAAMHSIVHFGYLYRSDHSFFRKFVLHIELIYQVIQNFFAWFSLGNYYIAFVILTSSMNSKGVAWKWVSMILEYVYVGLLLLCFILALGNRPQGSKIGYTLSMVGFALITVYMMFCAIYLSVIGITSVSNKVKDEGLKDGAEEALKDSTFINIVLSLSATYGLYVLSSLIAMDPWHLITSFVQYILLAASYINVLNVYAFCNVHDVSWGTKGSDKVSDDLGVVKSDGDHVTVEVPVEQKDINAQYDQELLVLSTPPPKEEAKANPDQVQEDYYKNFRTNVLTAWVLSNGLLAAVILRAGGDDQAKRERFQSTYMGVLLYTVAGLAFFRFLGASLYMVLRLFQGE